MQTLQRLYDSVFHITMCGLWSAYHFGQHARKRLTLTLMKWAVRSNQEFCLSGKTNKDNFLPLHRGTRGQSSLRDLLQPLVEGVLNDKNLSINTNPLEVYKAWINQMESETGEARYECIIVCLHRDKLLV